MATTIGAIVAAVIGAGGAIGGGVLQSQAAGKAAGTDPKVTTIPPAPYQQALNELYSRAIALNMAAVPPSFSQYVQSGGTAVFPYQQPGITPLEARELGLVSPTGGAIPYVPTGTPAAPGTTQVPHYELTQEQKDALAKDILFRREKKKGSAKDPALAQYKLGKKIEKLDVRESDLASRIAKANEEHRERLARILGRRESRLEAKESKLRERLGRLGGE
jgi:hypothetical protein